jgi:hypothetical protein
MRRTSRVTREGETWLVSSTEQELPVANQSRFENTVESSIKPGRFGANSQLSKREAALASRTL